MDDLVKRMNDARNFPSNTCGASRHAAIIAEALCGGEDYPMLADEPEYCGESIAATVAALWECRAKLTKAEEAARLLNVIANDISDWLSQDYPEPFGAEIHATRRKFESEMDIVSHLRFVIAELTKGTRDE